MRKCFIYDGPSCSSIMFRMAEDEGEKRPNSHDSFSAVGFKVTAFSMRRTAERLPDRTEAVTRWRGMKTFKLLPFLHQSLHRG